MIEIPRPLWWLILHGMILRIRPKRIAKYYQEIWTEEGSPLFTLTRDLVQALRQKIHARGIVEMGMRYGNPSIASALEKLKNQKTTKLIVLPLYPQYAAATTASTFDVVTKELKKWRFVPELHFINGYHNDTMYLDALVTSIKKYWEKNKPGEKLLFSFHGIPKRSVDLGDPYYYFCHETARLVANQLSLPQEHWQVVFQSRFGKAEWLKPYCVETLQELAKKGVQTIDIVTPGFAVDCLETLEEIAMTNKEIFLEAGGKEYHYIPALNTDEKQVNCLLKLLEKYL